MKLWKIRAVLVASGAVMACGTAACRSMLAQEPNDSKPPVTSVDQIPADARETAPPNTRATYPADGRHTGVTKQSIRFRVRTLEPLEAGSGIYLPAGAQITGHVSRVDPAGVAGRAKIWLVFDEIRAKFGWLPIVADVVGVPGDHSIKMTPEKEGMLESKTSTQQSAGAAAAEGAGKGAIRGIKDKNAKEAAEYAAVGALQAYLIESGRGHEMNLPKGSKLELELERALYLVKD